MYLDARPTPPRRMWTAGIATLLAVSASGDARSQPPVFFDDVAAQAGVLDLSFGRGAAMVDLDRDGLLDLADANTGNRNTIYRQLGGGLFQDVTVLWNGDSTTQLSFGILAADFDNDGDDDIFYNNGGFSPRLNRFYRNDLTTPALTLTLLPIGAPTSAIKGSFGSTTLDFDNDGLLDIFVNQSNGAGGSLFRNLGSLVFGDVSVTAGIPQDYGNGRHCGTIDLDNDGWWDIIAGHSGHDSQLFRNNADGTFTDIAAAAGITAHGTVYPHFGGVADDLDNDGFQDLLVPIHNNNPAPPTPVYRNNGDSTFQLVSGPGSGMGAQRDMGYTLADFDMDGHPDFWSGTGGPHADGLNPNVLYRILPGGPTGMQFIDITSEAGLLASGPSRSHGSAVGDIDDDGDLDFYQNDGGPNGTPSTIEENSLWLSRGNPNHWIKIDVEGRASNRTGVGLRATAHMPTRDVHRWLSVGKGFSNTDSHTIHLGLGQDTQVDEITLRWPSGIVQSLHAPTVDTSISVVETGIALRGTVDVGASFELLFAGPGNASFLLFGSLATAEIWVPQVQSTLLLQPPLITLGAFPLPAESALVLPVTVPNDPNLKGKHLHIQGFVGTIADGTFTNALTLAVPP